MKNDSDILHRIRDLPEEIRDYIIIWLPFHFHIRLNCRKLANISRNRFPLTMDFTESQDMLTHQYSLSFVNELYHIKYTKYYDEQVVKLQEWDLDNCFKFFATFNDFQGSVSFIPNACPLALSNSNINQCIFFYFAIEVLVKKPNLNKWQYCTALNTQVIKLFLNRKNYLAVYFNSAFRVATSHYSGFCREIVLSTYWATKFLINDFLSDKQQHQVYINGDFRQIYSEVTLSRSFLESNFLIFVHN